MKLSEFLKSERIKRSLTQEEMAKGIGITRPYYSSLETGWFNKKRKTNAGIKTVRKIAEFTNVSTDYVRMLIMNEKGE